MWHRQRSGLYMKMLSLGVGCLPLPPVGRAVTKIHITKSVKYSITVLQ